MKWVLLLLLLSTLSVHAETFQAGAQVKVSIDQIRDQAFKGTQARLDTTGIGKKDPDFLANLRVRLKQVQCYPDRFINIFTDGTYVVTFYGETDAHYYKSDGRLYMVERRSQPAGNGIFPIQSAGYKYPSGKLVETRVLLAPYEDYNFNKSGELTQFCIKDTCYNGQGTPAYKREYCETCTQAQVSY